MQERIWDHGKIAYGGDYNPEQWPEETWEEDMRLLKLAHVDMLTLNVFSWAALQPSEDTYDFSRLDRIMDLAKDHGMKVCLATSTAAHPAWMARKYPEVLRTDFGGRERKYGARHNSCPNSPVYRKFSARLAGKLAERYGKYENLAAWHISNEYGGECYCGNCEKAFREWLRERYGTLEELNRAWNTAFWGHTFYDWEEIVLPDSRSEHLDEDRTLAPGISLDYRRFNSESILSCYRLEYEAVKEHAPDIPVTTNLMVGAYKPLDYRKWARHMDFISWDNYPFARDPAAKIAMNHDIMRGLKGGKPFALMEQSPSRTNWQPVNALKRPGVMRLQSYQAVAHGADAVMFFQMKGSRGSFEKYHGAVIGHSGQESTRVFREVARLGEELSRLGGEILGSRVPARAAMIFDWENWWAAEYSAGPTGYLSYTEEAYRYYRAFHQRNIPVDIIGEEDDFSEYRLLVAPILYMVKPGVDGRIRDFVKRGGTFLATYYSGYVDEHDLVTLGGYPGRLRDILGIWVEESDALFPDQANRFHYHGREHEASLLCDLLHLEGAEALASYEEDFYAGMPVLTRNAYGKGQAYYAGARFDDAFYDEWVGDLCEEQGIAPVAETPDGVEAALRVRGEESYLFLLNHGDAARAVAAPEASVDLLTGTGFLAGEEVRLAPKGVAILKTGGGAAKR